MDWIHVALTVCLCICMAAQLIPYDGSTFGTHFRKNWIWMIPFVGALLYAAIHFIPFGALWSMIRPLPINGAVLAVQIISALALLVWVCTVCPRNRQEWTPWYTPILVIGAIIMCTSLFLYNLEQLKIPTADTAPKVERED
jgi:hypothetical protein